MEAIFDTLKKQGKNTVDNLVKWLQDANIIGKDKDAVDKVMKLFEGVTNTKDVPLDMFKKVVAGVASDQQKTADDVNKQLSSNAPNMLEAAASSAVKSIGGALKNAFNSK